jgi:hypothetical protein
MYVLRTLRFLSRANFKANGEQDQGIPFKGPGALEEDSSAVSKAPDLEANDLPTSMASALRKESLKNIGQRRRSSASNQPNVNLRKGNPSFSVNF